jgi:MFS family permease
MMACDALSFMAYMSVPLAVWLGILGIGQLIGVVLVVGLASVLFSSAFPAYLPSIVDSEDLVEGNAKLTGSASAAQIAGPGLGGAIVQLAGASIGLLANAISFAVSFIGLAAIRARETPVTPDPEEHRGLVREVKQGLGFVLNDPFLRPLLILGPPINFFWTGITALRAVFLVRTVGIDAGLVGVALAAGGAGGVLGAMLARPLARRFGSSYTSLGALVLGLPFALLLPLATRGPDGVILFLLGQFVLVSGIVISNVLFGSFFQNYVPNHMLGRVSATTGTASYALMLIGALVAGGLSELLGIRTALWILSSGITISGLVYLKAPLRHSREFPAARSARESP